MKQILPDFTLTGVHAAGLQTRAVTECLNCTKPFCDLCPKPREENDKNRRRSMDRTIQRGDRNEID